MSRSRRRTLGALAVVVGAALVPSMATAAPDGSLSGLRLHGEDTCGGIKNVYATPHTPYLFGPVRLLGEDFTPTGQVLLPYEVMVVSGDGLKARHLLPGDPYTRPGQEPTNLVTCLFTWATEEDGSFEVEISGTLRGQ